MTGTVNHAVDDSVGELVSIGYMGRSGLEAHLV